MLKKMFVVLSLLTTVSLFADEAVEWSWDLEDAATIKSAVINPKASEEIQNYIKNVAIPIQLALLGKNDENTTYEQFKEIVANVKIDENAVPKWVTDKNDLIARTILRMKKFNKFKEAAMNDPELKDYHIVIFYMAPSVLKTPEAFRKYYFEDKMLAKRLSYDGYLKTFLTYRKNSIYYTPDQVKEDMMFFKRLVYPYIDVHEKWKTLAVKIELMIKSVEN